VVRTCPFSSSRSSFSSALRNEGLNANTVGSACRTLCSRGPLTHRVLREGTAAQSDEGRDEQECKRGEPHQERARRMHSRVYNSVSTLVSPCVVLRASLDVTEARAVFPRLRPRPPLRARPCRLLWEHHGDTHCRAHFGIRLYSTIFRRSPPQFPDTTVTDACTRCAGLLSPPIAISWSSPSACTGFTQFSGEGTSFWGGSDIVTWGSL